MKQDRVSSPVPLRPGSPGQTAAGAQGQTQTLSEDESLARTGACRRYCHTASNL